MKKILSFLVLFLVFSFMVGCGDVTPSDKVLGITITSEGNVRTMKVNETLQLVAKVFPETADQSVIWDSLNKEVATIDENGLVTALKEGSVEISATSKADTSVLQYFAIIVEEAEEVVINPESVTIKAENDITTCKVGEKINLSATVYPTEANQAVSWESSDTTIATVARGEVTPLKEGTVVITVVAKGFENVKATITLTFEPADDPVLTKDWANMEFSTHENYMEVEDGTPLKVKGVVTHVSPEKDNTVTYVIQNGTEGYYIYAQNSLSFPVELGKVYEIGGFKKYYRGLNEIVDVEYFKAIDENITFTKNDMTGLDTSSLSTMEPFHSSMVTGKAIFKNASISDTKAYSFYANVNGHETIFRVDPSYMTEEEFKAINEVLYSAVSGTEFEFVGLMSAFGYGTPTPQIQVVKASDLTFAELSAKDMLVALSSQLTITSSVAFSVNEIELPNSLTGVSDVSVAWSSDNTAINVETGAVTHGSENVTVTLTATLTYSGETYEKTFEVLVFAADNTEYEIVASLDLEDAAAPNQWGNSETKSGYAEGTVVLGNPKATWLLRNALIAAATNDIYDGKLGIRAQAGKTADATGRIEIQQDGEYNVVEFDTAVYGNDASGIQIKIEYSTDSGTTWVECEEVVTVDSKTLQTYRIKLPEGTKRVALVIVENSGRRVNIDNIKLMK